jgi:glycosyltransferase involved in cell wall biosynthesis
MATLVVPSTSAPCGLVSYLTALARLELPAPPAFLVTTGSVLAGDLGPGIETVESGPSRREMTAALRDAHARFTRVETHGPRSLVAARAARIAPHRIRHVFHESPFNDPRRGLGEVALGVGLRRYANGQALADGLRRVGIRVEGVLPPVLWPPADPLSREAARHAIGISGDVLLGVVGRLNRSKAPLLALEAVHRLPAALRDRVTLVFVGDGPETTALRDRAAALDRRVVLLGTVPAASRLLPAFDAVIVPSPRESFGLTLTEAAIAGVPVAAVRSPGASLIAGGDRRLELAAPDPDSLATCIARALAQPADAGDALRDHILGTYGPQASTARYAAHYADEPAAVERDRV